MIEESFKVNFESWNNAGSNNFSELGVYNIQGENYFHGMISEMCKKDDIIVATINASKLISGEIEGVGVALLGRHGRDHRFSPTNVNYRANLLSLRNYGRCQFEFYNREPGDDHLILCLNCTLATSTPYNL